jgi:hypothetical protein
MNKDNFITITNEDIYRELQAIKELGELTHAQAVKTNGRVNKLESTSLGLWISKHPFKFTIFVIVFLSLLAPDTRESIMLFVKTLV